MGCASSSSAPEPSEFRGADKAKGWFDEYDADNSGSIDAAELSNVLSDWKGFEVSRCTVSALISEFDQNHDGVLQLPEFMRMSKKLHVRLGSIKLKNDSIHYHVSFGRGNTSGERGGLNGIELCHCKDGMRVISVSAEAGFKQLKVGDVATQINGVLLKNLIQCPHSAGRDDGDGGVRARKSSLPLEWADQPVEGAKAWVDEIDSLDFPLVVTFMAGGGESAAEIDASYDAGDSNRHAGFGLGRLGGLGGLGLSASGGPAAAWSTAPAPIVAQEAIELEDEDEAAQELEDGDNAAEALDAAEQPPQAEPGETLGTSIALDFGDDE